uniref:Uncharacterized protein n=1 Tax=Glossina palpalis gambiensis TaxID=67801 RepID=A0A1B0C788_9MUSC
FKGKFQDCIGFGTRYICLRFFTSLAGSCSLSKFGIHLTRIRLKKLRNAVNSSNECYLYEKYQKYEEIIYMHKESLTMKTIFNLKTLNKNKKKKKTKKEEKKSK